MSRYRPWNYLTHNELGTPLRACIIDVENIVYPRVFSASALSYLFSGTCDRQATASWLQYELEDKKLLTQVRLKTFGKNHGQYCVSFLCSIGIPVRLQFEPHFFSNNSYGLAKLSLRFLFGVSLSARPYCILVDKNYPHADAMHLTYVWFAASHVPRLTWLQR